MSERERIGVHLKYRLLVAAGLEEEDPRGGPLSEWILGAAERCLSGDLSIDRAALEIPGFRVGKNLRLPPDLLEEIEAAAEAAGLSRSGWLESAIFARLEAENLWASDRAPDSERPIS